MKTKTLLMVAGAGGLALLYWKWYRPKRAERKRALASNQYECEELAGGTWLQPNCITAPCRGTCVK